jgi:hypothetical protein
MRRIKYLFFSLIFAGCGQGESNGEVNYRKMVDRDAEFIGQGLTVKEAGKEWDWFLPDLNSTAQMSANSYEFPPESGAAEYVRSYSLDEDIGYIWRWEHKGEEIFLVYHFRGGNGYRIRVLHNTEKITIDEAILAVYFDSEFNFYLDPFRVEKWEIRGVDDKYSPESFHFVGRDIYDKDEFTVFDGRIVTLYRNLFRSDGSGLCIEYNSDHPCVKLPPAFDHMLSEKGISQTEIIDLPVYASVKVALSETGDIASVLGAELVRVNEETGEEAVIGSWPIPEGYLGAGTYPFYP